MMRDVAARWLATLAIAAGVVAFGLRARSRPADVALLAAALDDPRGRDAAAFALGELGPAARDAVPALLALGRSDDARLLVRVAWALSRIAGDDASVQATLAEIARSPQPLVRRVAEAALARTR